MGIERESNSFTFSLPNSMLPSRTTPSLLFISIYFENTSTKCKTFTIWGTTGAPSLRPLHWMSSLSPGIYRATSLSTFKYLSLWHLLRGAYAATLLETGTTHYSNPPYFCFVFSYGTYRVLICYTIYLLIILSFIVDLL